jgi:multicomponent Na+:H+ antiporter subunit D
MPHTSLIPIAAVAVPLLVAIPIVLSARRPNLREAWTLAAAFATVGLIVSMLPGVLDGDIPELKLFQISPAIPFTLRADPLGLFFALISSSLWLLTSFYSIGYMRGHHEHKQTRYYACFAITMSAAIGLALSANLLTFLIFFEVLTFATYPLVIHRETPEAIAGGRKYLAYTMVGGLALLGATAWTYSLVGTLDFRPGGILTLDIPAAQHWGLFLLFCLGVGVKAGVMPLHSWLPTAMVAPTPVSALLHAVAVVKAGVFGFLRVIGFIFGTSVLLDSGAWMVLAVLASITIIVGSFLALGQDHLKRRLAYSTVSHLSYIVLGAALLGTTAWMGAVLHLAAHAVMKITLFFCAGAIDVKTHRTHVSEMDGIGRQMPITMGAFAIASIGMAGLPPIIGFTSKWHLALGVTEAGYPIFMAFLLISGLLNMAYLFPIIYRAFMVRSPHFTRFDEASWFMVVPLALTGIFSLVLGIVPNVPLQLFRLAATIAASVTGGGG